MAKNKPYNISSKTPKKGTTKKKRVSNKIKETIENTTKIRIDKERLNDTSSLDTSFLEGRVDAQSRRKVLNSKVSNKKSIDLSIFRNIVIMILLLVLLIVTVLTLMNHSTTEVKEPKVKKVKEEKTVTIVDNNYLFVGDRYTEGLNFEDLDYHYTKLVDTNYTTEDVLNEIDSIYRYNPSKVFIELGIVDLKNGAESIDIVTNLSEIIDGIKKNRTYAKIYVESIYPINTEIEGFEGEANERIVNLNKLIKELAKDKDVEYIDVYNKLVLYDKLNTEYTEDGESLNEQGYEQVWNLLRKVVDENGGKEN